MCRLQLVGGDPLIPLSYLIRITLQNNTSSMNPAIQDKCTPLLHPRHLMLENVSSPQHNEDVPGVVQVRFESTSLTS